MPDHPAFVRHCATVEAEGAAGYVTPGRPYEANVMVRRPNGHGVVVTGLRFDQPDRSIRRILQGAHR